MDTARRMTFALLRIAAGTFFLLHGGQKILGWFGGPPGGLPAWSSQMGVAGLLELIGGTLLVIGLLTQPVAFLLAGEMAVAYFQAHFPRGFWPIQNQGEAAALYCMIWLFFAAHGAGPFSVDALIARGRSTGVGRQATGPVLVERPDGPPRAS